MPELSSPLGFVVNPKALVSCSVWPNLDSVSMFLLSYPLTLIDCSVLENDFTSFF
jgi:hypothetical protein